MNSIKTQITSISTLNNLNIIESKTHNDTLTMMSLDLPESLKKDSLVKLAIKPTNIMLAKEKIGAFSCENRLEAKIINIEKGELLCSVTVEYLQSTLEAIITLNAANSMQLKVNEDITLLIKASDIYIKEILSAGELL